MIQTCSIWKFGTSTPLVAVVFVANVLVVIVGGGRIPLELVSPALRQTPPHPARRHWRLRPHLDRCRRSDRAHLARGQRDRLHGASLEDRPGLVQLGRGADRRGESQAAGRRLRPAARIGHRRRDGCGGTGRGCGQGCCA